LRGQRRLGSSSAPASRFTLANAEERTKDT